MKTCPLSRAKLVRAARPTLDDPHKPVIPPPPCPAPCNPPPTVETGLIHHGDNLDVLPRFPDDCIDLIYVDPPFHTNRVRRAKGAGTANAVKANVCKANAGKANAFDDRFDSVRAYIDFMRPRCEQLARVLKPTGSLYHHCDHHAVHYIKVMLDEIFGEASFINEIIWVYESGGRARRHFHRKHDTLLLYAPGAARGNYTFNAAAVATPRNQCPTCAAPREQWNHLKKHTDQDGRTYRTIRSNGKLYRYYDDAPTTPSDVWHINHLQQKDPQRTNYPTQKPLALLDRIIKASSNESDIILDPFTGSGTTLQAAKNLDRQWIGIDQSQDAVAITRQRLATP